MESESEIESEFWAMTAGWAGLDLRLSWGPLPPLTWGRFVPPHRMRARVDTASLPVSPLAGESKLSAISKSQSALTMPQTDLDLTTVLFHNWWAWKLRPFYPLSLMLWASAQMSQPSAGPVLFHSEKSRKLFWVPISGNVTWNEYFMALSSVKASLTSMKEMYSCCLATFLFSKLNS